MNMFKTTSLIAALSILSFASLVQAQDEAPPTISRAEVIADMQIWIESGAAGTMKYRDDARHPEFVAAVAKYEQMRASPDFAKRVAVIAAERGEQVQLVAAK